MNRPASTTFFSLTALLAALALPMHADAAVVFSQNFDSVVAPSLPAGWVNSEAIGFNAFSTSTSLPAAGVNGIFIGNPSTRTDTRLVTRISLAGFTNGFLTFQNSFGLENGFDGGVLEASLNGGTNFADILSFGAIFTTGGYTDTISSNFGSPIGGRNAWTGNSGGYITTTVDLPTSFDGQDIILRWRLGTDEGVGAVGWRIDTVALNADSNAVPEPGALALAALALATLAVVRRSKA